MPKYHSLHRDVLRPLVLVRDGYACVLCGLVYRSNHIHHTKKNHGSEDINTLVTVCKACHPTAERMTFSPTAIWLRTPPEIGRLWLLLKNQ